MKDPRQVQADPYQHDQGLRTEEHRRPEKTRERLRSQRKTVIAKGRRQMRVGAMKAQVVNGCGGSGLGRLRHRDVLCQGLVLKAL